MITEQNRSTNDYLIEFSVVLRQVLMFSCTTCGYTRFLWMKQLRGLQGLARSITQRVLIFHLEWREKLIICYSLSEPSTAPSNITSQSLNETTYSISWDPLTRETSNGEVLAYEVKDIRVSHAGSPSLSAPRYENTTNIMVTLQELIACSTYHVLVRAYTSAGAGPFSPSLEVVTSGRSSNIVVFIVPVKNRIRGY